MTTPGTDHRLQPPALLRDFIAAAILAGRVIALLLAATLTACFCLALKQVDIDAIDWLPDCPARLAGGACALCGMTRSFLALCRGQVSLASEFNPLGLPLFAMMCACGTVGIVSVGRDVLLRLRSAQEPNPE